MKYDSSFELSELWDLLDSQIYKVCDEEGVNVANALVRHFNGYKWLYVDDDMGYYLIDDCEVDDLYLEKIER